MLHMHSDATAPIPPIEGALTAEELARQRKLKGIVIGLGLLILLAFAGVVIGMVQRASRIGKGPVPAATASAGAGIPLTSTPAPALLRELKLSLPRGSEVKSSSLQGSRLLVQHEGPAGAGFLVVDLATGAVVSRVTVERER